MMNFRVIGAWANPAGYWSRAVWMHNRSSVDGFNSSLSKWVNWSESEGVLSSTSQYWSLKEMELL